jgi:hypothetical protein
VDTEFISLSSELAQAIEDVDIPSIPNAYLHPAPLSQPNIVAGLASHHRQYLLFGGAQIHVDGSARLDAAGAGTEAALPKTSVELVHLEQFGLNGEAHSAFLPGHAMDGGEQHCCC